jgi:hypothetical protein
VVKAGVDDQARGAEGDRVEIAEAADLKALVDSELVGELLGVERPAFGISVEGQQGADQRQLVGIFALPDVAGDRFMVREARQVVAGVLEAGLQVDPELAGAPTVPCE